MRADTSKRTAIIPQDDRNTDGVLLNLDEFDCPSLPYQRYRVCKTNEEAATREKINWILAYGLIENEVFLDIWNYAIRQTSDTFYEPGISDKPGQLPGLNVIDLSVLERLYNLINKDAVMEFIKGNSYLFEVLSEANKVIRKYFPGADLYLRLAIDPDSDALEKELVLYISTDLTARAAIELRNKFFADWWYNNLHRTKNNLCITLAFK